MERPYKMDDNRLAKVAKNGEPNISGTLEQYLKC
jgi:hypothetical protein